MKKLSLYIITLLLTVVTTSFYAQTADEIINKFINTTGGAEKWKAIKGIKMEMTTNKGGMEIPVEVVQLPGGKMYVKIN